MGVINTSTSTTIKGAPFSAGQSFVAQVSATGMASSDGLGPTTTVTQGRTYYFQLYSYSNQVHISHPYAISWTRNGAIVGWFTDAIFPQGNHTISYNANGGYGAPGPQTKRWGETITLSTVTPYRNGYVFKGWSTSPNGGVNYYPGSSYGANANATLYAIWELISYTISFNANGGSGAPSPQTKSWGSAINLSSTIPYRTDYIFKGWGYSASGNVVYQPGASYGENNSRTLYAIWERSAYTISFNPNGGYGTPPSQKKKQNVPLTLTKVKPVKNGHKFLGWNEDKNAKIAKYPAGGQYTDNAEVVLYAIWQPKTIDDWDPKNNVFRIMYAGETIFDPRSESLLAYDVSCSLETNSTGELRFTLPKTNVNCGKIDKMSKDKEIIFAWNVAELFRGRVTTTEENFDGSVTYICEGDRGYLNDAALPPYETYKTDNKGRVLVSSDPNKLFEWYISQYNANSYPAHRFNIGDIQVSKLFSGSSPQINIENGGYSHVWDEIKNQLINDWGGIVRIHYEDGNRYIDYLADTEQISTQKIEFGKNLVDFIHRSEGLDLYTAVLVTGSDKDGNDITLKNATTKPSYSGYTYQGDILINDELAKKHGIIIKLIDTNIENANDIPAKAHTEAAALAFGDVIECRAVDMSLTDEQAAVIEIGDYVEIISKPNNFDRYFVCTRKSWNVDSIGNTSFTFGSEDTLTRVQKAKLSKLNSGINDLYRTATKLSEENKKVAAQAGSAELKAEAAQKKAEEAIAKQLEYETSTDAILKDLQKQVDGAIETWFYSGAPSLGKPPSLTWDETERTNHLGDLYYDTDTGYSYRFANVNNEYLWLRITDVDVTKALKDAADAKDLADKKRRVFTSTPTAPYDAGDLWYQNGSLFTSLYTRANAFVNDDWVELDYASNEAMNRVNQAAQDAVTEAANATKAANDAKTASDEATAKVATLEGNVSTVTQVANDAKALSETASSQAQDAIAKAGTAVGTAQAAKADAEKAIQDAANVSQDLADSVASITQTMEADYTKKTELTETVATIESSISQSAAEIKQTVEENYAKKTELSEVESTLRTDIQQNADQISQTASRVNVVDMSVSGVADQLGEAQKAAASAARTAAETAQAAADARALADKAQETAEAAQTDANNAQAAATAANQAYQNSLADLQTAKDNLAALMARPDATDEQIQAAQEAVNTAQTASDEAKAAYDKAAKYASDAQIKADEAQAKATEAANKIPAAQEAAEQAKNAAEIAQAASDLANEEIAGLPARVSQNETEISQNADSINLIARKTEYVGSRNYVLGTDESKNIVGNGSNSQKVDLYEFSTEGISIHDNLTISFRWSAVYNSSLSGTPPAEWGSFHIEIGIDPFTRLSEDILPSSNNTNGRYIYTFNLPDEWMTFLGNKVPLKIVGNNLVATVVLGDFQIEKGYIPTDWHPAPDDVQEQISKLQITSEGFDFTTVSNTVESLESRFNTLTELINQNGSDWSLSTDTLDSLNNRIENYETHVILGQTEDGNASITLSTDDSAKAKLQITNEQIAFVTGGTTAATITPDEMSIENARIEETLSFSDWMFFVRDNGNLTLKWNGNSQQGVS